MDETFLLDTILADAYLKGISDIQFKSSTTSEKHYVLFHIDNVMQIYMTIPNVVAEAMVNRVKTMAHLDDRNNHLPNIGRFKFSHEGLPEFYITVIAYPTDCLWKIVDLKIQNN
jgi:type II secretory ATPase GspE/PulE/Tfp pilus assembly ATPase PilB-like protein